jgi:hypothetical protein
MRQNLALTVASLLSIVFVTLHVADDIVRGMEKGDLSILIVVPILVLWLYGTVELAGRRSGYLIILLESLLGLAVPLVHFKVPGGVVRGDIAKSSGALLFVGTQLALGITSLFSVLLAVRGLWRPTISRTP